jgi:hypothetical protein
MDKVVDDTIEDDTIEDIVIKHFNIPISNFYEKKGVSPTDFHVTRFSFKT